MNMNMSQKKDEMDSLKTDDDSSNNSFDMKFQEALSYLDEVKMSFKEQPSVYNEFLDILCSQDLDIPSVIRRVSYLFRDQQTKFVLGFNTFLPNDYKIQLNDEEDDDDDIYDEEEDDDNCNQEEEGDDEVLADDIVATTVALSGMKHLNDCYDHENSTSSRKLKYDDYSSSTDDGLYQMYGDDDDGDHALLLLQQPPNKVRRRSQQQQQRRSRSSKSSPRSSMNILASTASVAASGATNVNDQQIQILKAIDSGMFDRLAALSSSGPEELGGGDDSHETTTMMNDDENSQHHQTTASASAVKPEPLSNGAAQVSEDSNMSSPSTKSPSPKLKTPTTTKKRKQKDVSKSTTTNTTKKQSRTSIGSSGGGGSGSRGRGKPRRVIPQNKVFIDGEPRDVDVVSGRGGRSNNHPGNQTHWLVMLKHRSTYNSCGNDDAAKNRIAQDVVDFIEKRQGGRYVQRCKETNCWFVLPNKVALEKVKQGLRDKHVPDWVGKHNSDPNKIPIPQAQPQPQPPKILPPSSHHHQQQHHHHHQQMNHQHQHRNLVRGGMNYYQGY